MNRRDFADLIVSAAVALVVLSLYAIALGIEGPR